MTPNQSKKHKQYLAKVLGGLGATGVAIQNYQAVELFLLNMLKSGGSASNELIIATHVFSAITGGLCSGMVNYWMNVELLNDFEQRVKSESEQPYENLSFWQKVQYHVGLYIFIATGLLFGLMAFTFAETGPLATLSIAVGLLVSGIMTIQEVETWLSSYEGEASTATPKLRLAQTIGKLLGHLIALGNVVALSLLFTLSLSQSLIFIGLAANPAILIGATIAFSFGAFTEFYFYNFYLADFCTNLVMNFKQLLNSSNAVFGLICVSTNAFVNAALTSSGIELLTTLIITSGLFTPPTALVITATLLSSLFAGCASLILGADFWIKQNTCKTETVNNEASQKVSVSRSLATSQFSLFGNRDNQVAEQPLSSSQVTSDTLATI